MPRRASFSSCSRSVSVILTIGVYTPCGVRGGMELTWTKENDAYILSVAGRRRAAMWGLTGFVERPDEWYVQLPDREKYSLLGDSVSQLKESAESWFFYHCALSGYKRAKELIIE